MPAPPPQPGGTGSAPPSVTFANPVIRGFNPDPTICVVPADADTGQPATYFLSTSTFEFFPGCAIHASTDLLNWRLIGHALTRRSQIDLRTVEPGAGSWASTLRYRPREKRWYLANGLFHRYRPAVDERIFPRGFYVYTDNIWDDNAWSDPVYFDNPGFDQDLFWDDATSKVYLSTTMRLAARPAGSRLKDFAIHISEVDLPTGRTLTPPAPIRASPHGIAEGSHIVRRGRFYYLFTAEGGTEAGHQEWVLRSDRGPLGPWEARAGTGAGAGGPLWYNGPGEEVQRTGHADVFEDGGGRWWAVLLGVRPVWDAARGRFLEPQLGEFFLVFVGCDVMWERLTPSLSLSPSSGRETFLVKVDWVDDWPVFNEGKNITLQTRGRDAVQAQRYAREDGLVWEADLSKTELELGWYQKNTPIKQTYSLTERPGHLRLYGTCFDLSSPEAPAMLLRKQASYSDAFHARMQFSPSKAGYEAGLVLWWSCFSYAAIGITRVELQDGSEELQVVARRPTGVAGKVESFKPLLGSDGCSNQILPRKQVSLAVECFETGYRLSLQSGTAVASFEIHVEDLTVMPPVGGAFTGVMYGLYAMGNGEPVLDPADFIGLKVTDLSVKQ